MALLKNSSGLNNDYWQKCVAVAQQLEAEGKITREACIAALKGDEDTYNEKMLEAAQKVIRGESPRFLTQQEIKALADQQKNPQPKKSAETPVRRDDTDEKLFLTGAKWLFLHATGLTVPYLAYKAYNALGGNLGGKIKSYHEAQQFIAKGITVKDNDGQFIMNASALADQLRFLANAGIEPELWQLQSNGQWVKINQQQQQQKSPGDMTAEELAALTMRIANE